MKFILEKAIKHVFGVDHGCVLTEIRTGETSCWRLSASFHTDSPRKELLFIKAKVAGEKPYEFLYNRMVSNAMAKMHNVGYEDLCQIHIYDPVKDSLVADLLNSKIDARCIIFEIQPFFKGLTVAEILRRRGARKRFQRDDLLLVEELCLAFHKIHSIKPPSKNADAFHGVAIKDIYLRIGIHLPVEKPHWLFGDAGAEKLIWICRDLVRKWVARSDRCSALHGDPRTANLIRESYLYEPRRSLERGIERGTGGCALTHGWRRRVVPIDFSRTMWGPKGYDTGRFLMDILELSCGSGNPYYNEFGQAFLNRYSENDPELQAEALLGVFSMLLIKLDPKGTPIKSPTVARLVYKRAMKMLSVGKVSFFD